MKKIVSAALVLVGLLAVNGYAADAKPVKFALVPSVEVPKTDTVHGVDFGLIGTKTAEVQGVQIGIFYSAVTKHSIGAQAGLYCQSADFDGAKYGLVTVADNVRGLDEGFVCVTKKFIGLQEGFVTVNTGLTGVQYGLVNVSESVSGLQLGFVNYTRVMDGVQVGLINIIRESSLPVMVLVNAKFK